MTGPRPDCLVSVSRTGIADNGLCNVSIPGIQVGCRHGIEHHTFSNALAGWIETSHCSHGNDFGLQGRAGGGRPWIFRSDPWEMRGGPPEALPTGQSLNEPFC